MYLLQNSLHNKIRVHKSNKITSHFICSPSLPPNITCGSHKTYYVKAEKITHIFQGLEHQRCIIQARYRRNRDLLE